MKLVRKRNRVTIVCPEDLGEELIFEVAEVEGEEL